MIKDLEFLLESGINEETVKLYERYYKSGIIKNKHTKETTYKGYLYRVKLFFEFVRDNYNNEYILSDEIMANNRFLDIYEDYLSTLIEMGNNNQTIRNKRTAISVFFDWCERRDYISSNPFRKIDHLKITEVDAVRKDYFLTQQQIWKIDYIMSEYPEVYDIQDKIIFNLFLDSAVRISAGHSLKLTQLDFEKNCFHDVKHKEGYVQPVHFMQKTKDLIKEWIDERNKIDDDTTDYLLVTKYGGVYKQMSKETIRARVRKIGKIVGIPDFYPHSIRKTIVSLVAQNLGIEEACEFAMHKNIKTTRDCYVKRKNRIDTINKVQDFRARMGI